MASWGACARLAILLSGGRPHDQCPVQALHLRGGSLTGAACCTRNARPQNQSERLSLVLCVPQFTVCGRPRCTHRRVSMLIVCGREDARARTADTAV